METTRLLLWMFGALGVAWGAGAVPGTWLSPANTSAQPYTFADAGVGTSFALPSASYTEWTVYNAASEAVEGEADYRVEADEAGTPYLAFNAALASDTQAYLGLGIAGDAEGLTGGYSLAPADGTQLRLDNLYATVRFVRSDAGIVCCLIVPAAAIAAVEITRIVRLVREGRKEKKDEEAAERDAELERLRREVEELKKERREKDE